MLSRGTKIFSVPCHAVLRHKDPRPNTAQVHGETRPCRAEAQGSLAQHGPGGKIRLCLAGTLTKSTTQPRFFPCWAMSDLGGPPRLSSLP